MKKLFLIAFCFTKISFGSWQPSFEKAKEIAKENHYKTLTVGTSDTGFQQIRFYEKNDFIKSGILKDFFIENYPDPIYENGLQMRDMVLLSHHLTE